MTPEIFGAANAVLRANPETVHGALSPMPDVPAFQGNGLCVTVWRPTIEEAALLVGGGVLVLVVQGESHPPLKMQVSHTSEVEAGMGHG
jgi:hypothetical protein